MARLRTSSRIALGACLAFAAIAGLLAFVQNRSQERPSPPPAKVYDGPYDQRPEVAYAPAPAAGVLTPDPAIDGLTPGPPPAAGDEPQLPCETSRDARDAAFFAEALPIVMADAERHAHGRPARHAEASIYAANPDVICGRVWFDAYGGVWSYVYADGAVHGRWRDLRGPQAMQQRYCHTRETPRSCWIAR